MVPRLWIAADSPRHWNFPRHVRGLKLPVSAPASDERGFSAGDGGGHERGRRRGNSSFLLLLLLLLQGFGDCWRNSRPVPVVHSPAFVDLRPLPTPAQVPPRGPTAFDTFQPFQGNAAVVLDPSDIVRPSLMAYVDGLRGQSTWARGWASGFQVGFCFGNFPKYHQCRCH